MGTDRRLTKAKICPVCRESFEGHFRRVYCSKTCKGRQAMRIQGTKLRGQTARKHEQEKRAFFEEYRLAIYENRLTYGMRLKKVLIERDVSAIELAGLTGVAPNTIRAICRDNKGPSKALAGRIDKALGVYLQPYAKGRGRAKTALMLVKHTDLGRTIRRERCQLDMTQTDLGERAGLSQRQISEIELGHLPTFPAVQWIGEVLGVDLEGRWKNLAARKGRRFTCPGCREEFYAHHKSSQRYCSRRCREASDKHAIRLRRRRTYHRMKLEMMTDQAMTPSQILEGLLGWDDQKYTSEVRKQLDKTLQCVIEACLAAKRENTFQTVLQHPQGQSCLVRVTQEGEANFPVYVEWSDGRYYRMTALALSMVIRDMMRLLQNHMSCTYYGHWLLLDEGQRFDFAAGQ